MLYKNIIIISASYLYFFAFTVMTTGLFSTEKAKTTAQAALTEASSSFIIKGPVLAKCSPGVVPIDCEVDANPIGKAEEFISQSNQSMGSAA